MELDRGLLGSHVLCGLVTVRLRQKPFRVYRFPDKSQDATLHREIDLHISIKNNIYWFYFNVIFLIFYTAYCFCLLALGHKNKHLAFCCFVMIATSFYRPKNRMCLKTSNLLGFLLMLWSHLK